MRQTRASTSTSPPPPGPGRTWSRFWLGIIEKRGPSPRVVHLGPRLDDQDQARNARELLADFQRLVQRWLSVLRTTVALCVANYLPRTGQAVVDVDPILP